VKSELLEILVCPRSKKKLVLADQSTLEKINKTIREKQCHDISGQAIIEPVSEALVQPDTKILYLVRDDIPILIYENGIKLQ